ncbi:hypothetical protein MMC22_007281 [Lobaria immixta]|nr:hypothetical protein [Lobaria immixta]
MATGTKGRDLELLTAFSTSSRHLPNEVLLMIFKLLDKNDLKSVRCACKFFEPLVSPRLFDEIYISPHGQNLDVFRNITEHSVLCRYPRELVYNVQRFKANIDRREYFRGLCHQLRCYALRFLRSNIHHADKEIEGLMHMARDSLAGGSPNKSEDYYTSRIVQRGFDTYREKAEEEAHYNNTGQLLACLCLGLTKLPYLDTVQFNSSWGNAQFSSVNWSKSSRGLGYFPSPFARAWSTFHLMPKAPQFGANIVHEFDNVISAFSLTKRPLKVLKADAFVSVPYEKFYTRSSLSRTFRQHSLAAMYHLECIRLQMDMHHYSAEQGSLDSENGFAEEKTLPVDLLATALLHMPRLRILSLAGSIRADGSGMMSISELFQAVRLPALEELDLSAMMGSAADILGFLRAQPRLSILNLSSIELSEGNWADLVDDMRRWLPLEAVDLDLSLRQDGAVDIWDECAWGDEGMSGQIENYILHGGKNPLRVPG